MTKKRTYGATIEDALNRRRMNKKQLAVQIGVSPGTIAYAVNEVGPTGKKHTPYPDTLLRIADALDIDPADLLRQAGFAEKTVRDLLDVPPPEGIPVADLDVPDQRLLKRIADLVRAQEKYQK